MSEPQYWLLFHATVARQHAGNEGYADRLGHLYLYDSTVPNHKNLSAGDHVAIWNNDVGLLGVSTIDRIITASGHKNRMRCPQCSSTGIKVRKNLVPLYRCHDCGEEFVDPVVDDVSVSTYEASYESSWRPLTGVLSPDEVKGAAVSRPSQHAIRPLRPELLELALHRSGRHGHAEALRIGWEIP